MTPDKLRAYHEMYRQRMRHTPAASAGSWGVVYGLAMQMCVAALNDQLVSFRNPTPEERAKMTGRPIIGLDWPDPSVDAPLELWPTDTAVAYGLNRGRMRRGSPDLPDPELA